MLFGFMYIIQTQPLVREKKEMMVLMVPTGPTGPRGPGGDNIDFSNLNAISTGPCPKTPNIGASGLSNSIGSIQTYTVSGSKVFAGQPVCVNINPTGPITCKGCDSTTSGSSILGIATKDTEVGQSVDILTDGYLTARRNNVMQPSGHIRDQGPMLALEMGNPFGFGYQTVNGSGYSSNYLNPDVVLLNGTLNVKDDGGKANSDGLPDELGPNVNYSDNVNYSAQFDAGIGKIIMMKTNNFEFEGSTSVLYDHLRIEWSNNGTTWSKLNSTVAPDISKWLYFVDTPRIMASQTIDSDDIGGNNNRGAVPVTVTGSDAEAYVFLETLLQLMLI